MFTRQNRLNTNVIYQVFFTKRKTTLHYNPKWIPVGLDVTVNTSGGSMETWGCASACKLCMSCSCVTPMYCIDCMYTCTFYRQTHDTSHTHAFRQVFVFQQWQVCDNANFLINTHSTNTAVHLLAQTIWYIKSNFDFFFLAINPFPFGTPQMLGTVIHHVQCSIYRFRCPS